MNIRDQIPGLIIGIGIGCAISIALPSQTQIAPIAATTNLEMAYSPDQGATDLVVKTINRAEKTIRVASYSFTSEPIAEALISAHNRGIDVKVVADGSNRKGKGSKIAFIQQSGIPARYNDQFSIMHDKFIIIDGKTTELGSFNYTFAADHRNAENVFVVNDNSEVASNYTKQWEKIFSGGTED